MTKDEALKLALEALEDLGMKHFENTGEALYKDTFTAIKEALAQPWEKFCDSNCVWTDHHPDCKLAQRLPLTDEAKDAARYRWIRDSGTDVSLVIDKRTEWVPPDDVVAGVGGYWMYEYRCGSELDEAIDQAIEAAHGIKGEA